MLCRTTPLLFRTIRYLWDYDDKAREYIHAMKYHPSPRLLALAGKDLAHLLLPTFPLADWDLIIPMSASAQAIRRRGLNQCLSLAREVARSLDLPLELRALKHLGTKYSQAVLPFKRRISNVRHAFQAQRSRIRERSILLIDDVLTTGATASAAGLALLRCGAASVDLLALARSEWWESNRAEIYRRIRAI